MGFIIYKPIFNWGAKNIVDTTAMVPNFDL